MFYMVKVNNESMKRAKKIEKSANQRDRKHIAYFVCINKLGKERPSVAEKRKGKRRGGRDIKARLPGVDGE